MRWISMSVSLGGWFFGSLIVSSFLALGLVYAYKTICALRYGDSDLQKYSVQAAPFYRCRPGLQVVRGRARCVMHE